jgi:pyruvate dehydrogenase E2 component (dihydrolipoamide acetyltransferase)
MLKEVCLPKLGQTVDEATIEKWHRQEGDPIQKGEPLLDITTDKATLEVESFTTGVVQKILYPPGTLLPCNAVIAFVGDEDVSEATLQEARERNATLAAKAKAAAGAPAATAPAAARAAAAPAPTPAAAPAAAPFVPSMPAFTPPPIAVAAPSGRLFASPRAKRVAQEHHVPLRLLHGSGPNGRIVEADVLAHAARLDALRVSPTARVLAAERGVDLTRVKGTGTDGRILADDVLQAPVAPALPYGQVVPLTAMRRIVAQRLSYSKQTIPHFYLMTDVDLTALVALRTRLNAAGGPKIAFHDLFLRALVRAYEAVPQMNVAWAEGGLYYRPEVNIGLAVALDEGLIVPVVRNCESRSLAELAQASADLVERARHKRLTPDEYEGGGLTISNVGMFGIDVVTPIINPGEAAILGVGRIGPRPVIIDSGIHIRQMSTFTLATDHRIVDGAVAAQFFRAFKDALEAPEALATP